MASSGHTVFMTYMLEPTIGNSKYIHCNYIKKLQLPTATPYQEILTIGFSNINDFKFLSSDITNGTGFTANKIYALVQLIANSGYTYSDDIKPIAANWKYYDLTTQIGHNPANLLTSTELTTSVFKIPLAEYTNVSVFIPYHLHDFINYPTKLSNNNELCFGDEVFFLGNVETDIKAIAYTTDIEINLPLNEFNSSTNLTWNGEIDKVAITEIGIYDENKNLVAIGKLNNPIQKDSTITRTISFALDF